MSSFIRTCILAAMVSSSLIACDDESTDTDLVELRANPTTSTSTSSKVYEIEDPDDLIFVDDLTVNVLVDPATAPTDLSTGVIDGSAMIIVDEPYAYPLKIKIRITVMPTSKPLG